MRYKVVGSVTDKYLHVIFVSGTSADVPNSPSELETSASGGLPLL
jgi:hypothetical protein